MPEVYHCASCNLIFQVGEVSYRPSSLPYLGVYLYVCADCGANYMIRRGINDFSKPLWEWAVDDLFIEFSAQSEPSEYSGNPSDLMLSTMGWGFNQEWQPILNLGQKIPLSDFQQSLKSFKCVYCGAAGSLTDVWNTKEQPCPRCHELSIRLFLEWMT